MATFDSKLDLWRAGTVVSKQSSGFPSFWREGREIPDLLVALW